MAVQLFSGMKSSKTALSPDNQRLPQIQIPIYVPEAQYRTDFNRSTYFGNKLYFVNRCVEHEELMPREELYEAYSSQFNGTIDASAKPVRLAFGALYVKQRLGVCGKTVRAAAMFPPERRSRCIRPRFQ